MTDSIIEKTCTGPCGRTLPLSSFNKCAGGKYERKAICKFCEVIQNRERHRANPEKRRSYYRTRRRLHGDKVRAAERKRNAVPMTRAKRYAASKAWRDNLRLEVVTAYGGFCVCCGESDIRFLTLDHVNQDGAEHRRQIGAQSSWHGFYLWARENEYPPTLRVLCWNCNNAAFRNNGVCPHQETQIAALAA